MEKKEFILCAGILYENDMSSNVINIERGTVICGHRHADCYKVLDNLFASEDEDIYPIPPRENQGFLTSHNRFVTRAEAFKIAKDNGQIISMLKDFEQADLNSEDLY